MKNFGGILFALYLGIGTANAAPVLMGDPVAIDIGSTSGSFSMAGVALNNNGDVAFLLDGVFARTSAYAIIDGNLREIRTVEPPSGSSPGGILGQSIDINDRGQVVYIESLSAISPDPVQIVIDTSGVKRTIATNAGPLAALPRNSFDSLSLNNGGRVAFTATLDVAPGALRYFIGDEMGVIEVGNPPGFQLTQRSGSINDNGEIAGLFSTDLGSLPNAIGLSDGVDFRIIANATSADVSLVGARNNNNGDVVYTLVDDVNGNSIFIHSEGRSVLVPISLLDETIGSARSINDLGDVLFTTIDPVTDQLSSISVWADGGSTTIARIGETLDDKVIASLFVGINGLNNRREVAFWAQFEDLTTGIFKATYGLSQPVPVPPALVIFAIGAISLGATQRKRRT